MLTSCPADLVVYYYVTIPFESDNDAMVVATVRVGKEAWVSAVNEGRWMQS